MNKQSSSFQLLQQILSQRSLHKQVLLLAIPMVLSNITVPLLGLVDAAVIGHLDYAWYLGGVALGSTMISVTFWLLGFLRMATTGLAAQAQGEESSQKLAHVWLQGMLVAWLLAGLFLLFHSPLAELIFSLSNASTEVKHYGMQYFSIRVWSAPAALANFVILGWLLGTQNAKAPMWLVIVINLANIILDVLFVLVFDWKVAGAAWASVLADYTGLALGLFFVMRTWIKQQLPNVLTLLPSATHGMGRMLRLNSDIFLRSLCLQAVFSFMTFQGAALGDDIVAANAVLMSFLMMVSYGMDGFAYAMEAMVGKAVGAKSRGQLLNSLIGTSFWGLVCSVFLTLMFWLFGHQLVRLITDIPNVQAQADIYLPWLIVMPLVSMWCFLLDGIFVGATKGKDMRNSMLIAMLCFFALYFSFASWGNHALWMSMLTFMGMRGIGLAVIFITQWKQQRFIESV
ncbi:MATE family efflux transporter DinF [Vibrio sp.]|uniref:MATE family efflux transporter DinF n=1 Tax=Vibrio sp. TaxID=678 RepID=UPI003AA897B9